MGTETRSFFASAHRGSIGLSLALALFALPAEADWIEVQKILASDGVADDNFGTAVAISGNWAIATTQFDDTAAGETGSAYVYERTDTGWVQRQNLVPSDAADFDRFGFSVAMDGRNALIGAYQHNGNNLNNAGGVYSFRLDPATGLWSETGKLLPADPTALSQFGYSVDMDGGRAVIGARLDNEKGTRSGSAFVYEYNSMTGTWMERHQLTASDGMADDWFGASVAVDGNRIIVGATEDASDNDDLGKAYIFQTNDGGASWSEIAKLTGSDQNPGDLFGNQVAIAGDLALVGAHRHDLTASEDGKVYAYAYNPVTLQWEEIQTLTASNVPPQVGINLGFSVDMDGTRAAIGARLDDEGGINVGAVYVFDYDHDSAQWLQTQKLQASDASFDERFGFAVDLDRNQLITSARLDNDKGDDSGSAYIFNLPAEVPTPAALGLLLAGFGVMVARPRR